MIEEWQKAIINAGIMGGITFCSVVVSAGGCVTVQSFTAASIAFGITFFTLLSKYFRPPETDVNDEVDRRTDGIAPAKPHGGGKVLLLWV